VSNTPSSRARLAVLASGAGSNLQVIHAHIAARGADASAELALVVSDRSQAGALEKARSWGVAAVHLPTARAHELLATLVEHRITLVALAGFLRLIPSDVITAFKGRILNVHPALLPAFGGAGMYGKRVHEAVLAAGARVSGATVHFVDEHYDEGAIIAQWPVPVRPDDTPELLAARILAVEHQIFPWCVNAVAAGAVRLGEDGRTHGGAAFEFDKFAPEPKHDPFRS